MFRKGLKDQAAAHININVPCSTEISIKDKMRIYIWTWLGPNNRMPYTQVS